MTRRTPSLLTVVLAGLALVGCATDDGAVTELEGLQGADLTIASKEFTEQLILGQMLVIALEEAGANVTDATSSSRGSPNSPGRTRMRPRCASPRSSRPGTMGSPA